jgi:hypothetical protein
MSLLPRKRRVPTPVALAALLSALMTACGSGDQPPPEPPPTLAVSGWVGDRGPWAAATVSFTCADGSTAQAHVTADGRYGAVLQPGALPCLVLARATDGAQLSSAATTAGTANVTPLSDAWVAATLRLPTSSLSGDAGLARALVPSALDAGTARLREALADAKLGTELPPITTPIGPPAGDPLVRAHGRLLDHLAARGVTPLTFAHALARPADAATLRSALAQGSIPRLLDLPSATAAEQPPQAIRARFDRLSGPAAYPFLLAQDATFRSGDGGHQWQLLPVVLRQVQVYKGVWLALAGDRLLTSADNGRTWQPAPGAPPGLAQHHLSTGPDGRLRLLSPYPGTWHVTSDGAVWTADAQPPTETSAQDRLAQRPPPLRRLEVLQGTGQVRSCLASQCVVRQVLNWRGIQGLLEVEGSDEVIAQSADLLADGSPALAVSSDGLSWRALGTLGTRSAQGARDSSVSVMRLPGGRLLAAWVEEQAPHLLTSDDDGASWQKAQPVSDASTWQPQDGAQLRDSGDELQLRVDAAQPWRTVPGTAKAGPPALFDWQPYGSTVRLRVNRDLPGQVLLSEDGGLTWTETLRGTDAWFTGWLGDRFAVFNQSSLYTSPDGRHWTRAPSGGGNAMAGDGTTWVLRSALTPTTSEAFESRDEGGTWTALDQPDTVPLACDGAVYLLGRGRLLVRRAEGWHRLAAVEPVATARCELGLLVVDTVQARHGQFVSADRGSTWTPIGRPGTRLYADGGRWWSVGPSTITLWP